MANEDNDIEADKDLDPSQIDEFDGASDSVVAEESQAETIKKLREKLKKCESEKIEYLTGWQKAKADFINLRKRDEDEKQIFTKFANIGLISELLSVLDNFEHAMRGEGWDKLPAEWRKGLEFTINQLHLVLEKNGVSKISEVGVTFDTNIHEAVGTINVENKEEDHVVKVIFQTGYKINERVIRPAKVKIGEYKAN
ncbi:MAG TPA: nucleotide exchange factor GrpE [Candidatus Paceibacterota bacterium]